jgi:hypothetical protein
MIPRAFILALLWAASIAAEPVRVRHAEGLVHGFLALRTTDGKTVADGDLIQNASGARVTSRLVFRFRDGSIRDETAVFTERGRFALVSDHLIQKGPTFKEPLEMTIDRAKGRVVVRHTNEHGEQKVEDEQMELPDDLANGMILTLLKNVAPGTPPPTLSMVAATPKPRVVKLEITSAGTDRFSINGMGRTARHYVVKIDIGGFAGLVAPLVGKQPPDSHVWILEGAAPAFVKSEGPLHLGGPIWRIELASPQWRQQPAARTPAESTRRRPPTPSARRP